MPVLQHAPRRHIGHWKPYYFGNSGPGLRKTARAGIVWHDFDHGITRDGYWRIGHGNPERVLMKSGRIRNYTHVAIDKLRFKGFRVGRPARLYTLAKKLGRKIEIEPKGKDPRYANVAYWTKLARTCHIIFGADWAEHFYAKFLDNGDVALTVTYIKAASAAGFTAGPTRDWSIPQKYLNR